MKKPMPRINMEKHRRAIPFRTFLSRLIWITVIPLVGLAVYLAVNDVYTLQAQLDQSTADRVHNVVSVIDRQIEAQIAGLEVLAASPLLDDTSRWNEFYREAVGYKENFGGHVVLADPSMKMILNTRLPFGESLPPLPRPGGHAAAPAVLETGNPSVGDMFLGPIAREPLVAVVVPVRREGQIRFLLLSLIETRRFEQRLQQLALPSAWSVTLLDGKKEVMTRRSPPGLEYKPDDSALNKRFTAKSALSQWSVVLEVPKEVYHAPVFTAGLALGIIIFVGTLAGVVGGRLVGRRLAQAVAGLSDIPPLSSGGLGIAEIETVRAALNEASEARRASEQSLQDAHRRLRSFVDANIVGVLVASPSGR
ncbi:MAG: hypothetical protein MUC98_16775, partial [Desulfobacterota bacterium]|nr:hypothetical protein [Thermodesulfobacteriota bacterium]